MLYTGFIPVAAVRCFDDGYEGKQPVAWNVVRSTDYKNSCLQQSMHKCTGCCNIIEITLKMALNATQIGKKTLWKKGENTGYQHFLTMFKPIFLRLSLTGSILFFVGVTLNKALSIPNLVQVGEYLCCCGDMTDMQLTLPKQALVFMCPQYNSFENTVGKGEIACNQQFLLFPRCFLDIWRTSYHFHQIWNCGLQTLLIWKSKICHLGKLCKIQLNHLTHYQTTKF